MFRWRTGYFSPCSSCYTSIKTRIETIERGNFPHVRNPLATLPSKQGLKREFHEGRR